MQVLYIEDDLIDQMTLQRLAAKRDIKITIANSVSKAKEIIQHESFDLIITDFYLGDGTAEDILPLFKQQTIVVITESDIDVWHHESNTLFKTSKPLQDNIFDVGSLDILLDLTYFHALTDNDIQFQMELLDTAITSIPHSIQQLQTAMQHKNFEQMKFEAHKMKSGLRVIGMKVLDTIEEIESMALQKDQLILFPKIENLITKVKLGIEEIKKERNKLEQV